MFLVNFEFANNRQKVYFRSRIFKNGYTYFLVINLKIKKMKKKLLVVLSIAAFFVTVLFIPAQEVKAECSTTDSTGWTTECDGSNLNCCEFNMNGQDYNCDGKLLQRPGYSTDV